MEHSEFQDLIEAHRYDDVEALWLERLESGNYNTDEFLQAAKLLRRQKEKERSRVLLGLLAERSLESNDWNSRLKVLAELARFEPLEQMKTQIREALSKV